MLNCDALRAMDWGSFKRTLHTLTKSMSSIHTASELAMNCAKYGLAREVVELLVNKVENEPLVHERVNVLLLVNRILKRSRILKGIAGNTYPAAVEFSLGRLLNAIGLLSADAPPGCENREECLKVLRIWLAEQILPESVVTHYINEFESLNREPINEIESTGSNFVLPEHRSPTERSVDDPVREIEGMLDEYGSFLSGFIMEEMSEDKGDPSSTDWTMVEHSIPIGTPKLQDEKTNNSTHIFERRLHILEDVEGEIEMEDAAPSCKNFAVGADTEALYSLTWNETSNLYSPLFWDPPPPLPENMPPFPPPLPSSPPPPLPPSPH